MTSQRVSNDSQESINSFLPSFISFSFVSLEKRSRGYSFQMILTLLLRFPRSSCCYLSLLLLLMLLLLLSFFFSCSFILIHFMSLPHLLLCSAVFSSALFCFCFCCFPLFLFLWMLMERK